MKIEMINNQLNRIISKVVKDRFIYRKYSWIILLPVVASLFIINLPLNKFTDVSAAALTWDGGGIDNNWSTCENWTDDICPGAGDSATFNATSTKDAVIDVDFADSVNNFNINAGYTGFITSEKPFSVLNSFNQLAGTVDWGNNETSLNRIIISGGLFISTSSTLTITNEFEIHDASYFSHNNGIIDIASTVNPDFVCSNAVFNQIVISANLTIPIQTDCTFPLGNNPSTTASLQIYGNVTGSGTLSVLNTGTTNTTMFSTGTLTGFSGYHFEGTLTANAGTFDFSSISDFTLNNTTVTIQNGGIISFPNSTGGDIQIKTLNLTAGTLNASGEIYINTTMVLNPSATFDASNVTIVLNTSSSGGANCGNKELSSVRIEPSGGASLNILANCNLPLGNNPTFTNSLSNITLSGTLTGTGSLNTGDNNLLIASTGSLVGFTSLTTNDLSLTGGSLDLSTYSTVTINRDFLFNSALSVFTAPPEMYIMRNFSNNIGTFNHNNGTIFMVGGAGEQYIAGDTTFNNLSKIVDTDVSSTLRFNYNKTYTILGELTLRGYSDSQRLLIRPLTLNNNIWMIDPQGERDMLYLDIRGGNNINASAIQLGGTGSIDSGNNTNISFANTDPNSPSSLGPVELVGGGTGDLTPTFQFSLSDSQNPLDTLRYRFQLSNINDFSNIIVDYTSDLSASGARTFTVGQAEGAGTYTVGTAGQELSFDEYYWRVKTIDNSAAESEYVTANGGDVAFIISNPPNIPTNLGPVLFTTGGITSNTNPTLTFDLSDPDLTDTVSYRIEISTTNDFTALVVSYTSALQAQGAANFTVGQALNGGTYTEGSVGQVLNETDYYWRVKAIDNNGVESNYISANAGAIAFTVGGNPPSIPSSPAPASTFNGSVLLTNQPSFSFNISDPDLDQVRYRIQISTNSAFTGLVVNYLSPLSNAGTKTFTVGQLATGGTYDVGGEGQVLSPDDYYWRVRAIDSTAMSSDYLVPRGQDVSFSISEPSSSSDTPLEYVPNTPSGIIVSETTSSDGAGEISQPSITLNLSDPNTNQQLRFRIEIDSSSSFDDADVIYISGLQNQGTAFFIVGQPQGDGQYIVGEEGQRLEQGDYYVRAKTIDSEDLESNYVYVNNGNIAFTITESEIEIPEPTPETELPDDDENNSIDQSLDNDDEDELDEDDDPVISDEDDIQDESSDDIPVSSIDEAYKDSKIIADAFADFIGENPTSVPISVIAVASLASLFAYPKIILLALVAIKNMFVKKKEWGLIYDNVTYSAIPLVTIRLYSSENKYIKETITDFKGQYGFIADSGSYSIEIKHSEYQNKSESINIKDKEELLINDIELSKDLNRKLNIIDKIQSLVRKQLRNIWQALFYFGFAISIISFIINKELVNLFVVYMFIVSSVIYESRSLLFAKPWGYLYDIEDNSLISGAIIRVINTENDKVEEIAVTDDKGRFLIKNKKGNYKLIISSNNYSVPNSKDINIKIGKLSKSSLEIGLEKNKSSQTNKEVRFGVL